MVPRLTTLAENLLEMHTLRFHASLQPTESETGAWGWGQQSLLTRILLQDILVPLKFRTGGVPGVFLVSQFINTGIRTVTFPFFNLFPYSNSALFCSLKRKGARLNTHIYTCKIAVMFSFILSTIP